jgi:hypothetical protein
MKKKTPKYLRRIYRAIIKGTADLWQRNFSKQEQKELNDARTASIRRRETRQQSAARCEKEAREIYVYRDAQRYCCVPSTHIRMAMVQAAKAIPYPGSTRKSAKDLFKAGVLTLTPMVRIVAAKSKRPTRNCDFVKKSIINVGCCPVPMFRPVFLAGWELEFEFMTLLEELTPGMVEKALTDAGLLNGIGDCRPEKGRFMVKKLEIVKEAS